MLENSSLIMHKNKKGKNAVKMNGSYQTEFCVQENPVIGYAIFSFVRAEKDEREKCITIYDIGTKALQLYDI